MDEHVCGERIRPVQADEFPMFMRTLSTAFGGHLQESDVPLNQSLFEPARSFAAFDGDLMVGTIGALSLELTLPGGALLPAAGLSWVGVLPTHRRRGLLRALFARQLDHALREGHAVAVFGASEGGIYRRFGCGAATSIVSLGIERANGTFAETAPTPQGRIRLEEGEEAAAALAALYDRARRITPGRVSRSEGWWHHSLEDTEWAREGIGPPFHALHDDASGTLDGYATYRIKEQWEGHRSLSELVVEEVVTTTAPAYADLWRYLLQMDLVAKIVTDHAAVDEPLRWLLADARHLRTSAIADDLWVRLLDVPAALAARGYRSPGNLILEVEDGFMPECGGRFALTAGTDGVSVDPTVLDPGIVLDAAALGAAYLGGVSFAALATAGGVREMRPGAVEQADLMFGVTPAPFNGSDF